MLKYLAVVGLSAVILGGGYAYSFARNTDSAGAFCHLDKKPSLLGNLMSISALFAAQDPAPGQQQPPPSEPDQNQEQQEAPPQNWPSHSYSAGSGCSRPDPQAEPDSELNGVDPNTVGCKCVKKCANDRTPQEDLSRDKNGNFICKNACHKARCACPDPCKT